MDDRYAIQLARTELREGYDTGDVERIVRVYSDSVVDMSDGQPTLARSEALAVLRARLRNMFAICTVQSAPAAADVLLLGDTAIDYGWHELTLTSRDDGTVVKRRTRYLDLWRKQADGDWRLQLRMSNLDQPPRLAEDVIAAVEAGTVDPVSGCCREQSSRSCRRTLGPGVSGGAR